MPTNWEALPNIVDHVTNREAAAVATLLWECGPEPVFVMELASMMLFQWDEWSERDPTRDHFKYPLLTTAKQVQRALEKPQPEPLLLDHRYLNDHVMLWLCEAFSSRREIGVLDLSFNKLTAKSLPYLVDVLRPTSIEGLFLGNNDLGDEGAALIASLLCTNKSLKRLNLSRIGLSNVGLIAIATAIASHPGVENLSVTNNVGIDDDGATACIQILHSIPVSHLDFRGCRVQDVGGRHGYWRSDPTPSAHQGTDAEDHIFSPPPTVYRGKK